MNNLAGGVWTPGTGNSTFGSANDVVNNSGLIRVRTGTTTLLGLENLVNRSGGVIDLTYGGANATDNLIT